MSNPIKATYEDLSDVPENKTGEIIDGELIVTSEPSWKHHLAVTLLDDMLAPYQLEEGCRERWVFLLKPKIKFGDSVLVPDLAGWKEERFLSESETELISVVPAWICEILSDETIALDKTKKMPIYAQHGLAYLWLIDPQYKTLGLLSIFALHLESGLWFWLDGHFDGDKARAAPFEEIELDFSALFQKLAVLAIKRQNISKSETTSRLLASLEAGLSGTEPDEPV